MKPKKKPRTKRGSTLNDEVLFEELESFVEMHRLDNLEEAKSCYVKMTDRGSDRLYFLKDRRYLHVTPHVFAWHNGIPSEIMYHYLIDKLEPSLVPAIKGHQVSSDGEIVALYDSSPRLLQPVYGTDVTAPRNVLDFFRKCGRVLEGAGVFPTVMNPKRIFYDGRSFGFFETGHFQNVVWRVNESIRIVDTVYSHPACIAYFPINSLKTTENVFVESLITGLLNFLCGSVAFLYFCTYGIDPVVNSKIRGGVGGKKTCSVPNGICQSIRSDSDLRDFFHYFYCQQCCRILPAKFKVKMERSEYRKETVRTFDEFVNAYETYLDGTTDGAQ